MLQAGFHRVSLTGYTGFKSSPYTEGALFYAEKLVAGQVRDDLASQSEPLAEPVKEAACKPGGT
jgi:hypothetical protein